jgi:glycogen phosphorylase
VKTGWPGIRAEHVDSSGVGDAAEVGALLSVRTFVCLGELIPDDVHVQVLRGKIYGNDVFTGVTVQDLDLAERYEGGRCRFGRPIVLDRGGAFGYTMRSRATTC